LRRRSADRRSLHQDIASAFKVSNEPLGDNVSHECIGVMPALAPLNFSPKAIDAVRSSEVNRRSLLHAWHLKVEIVMNQTPFLTIK
jgi:hypothetical protein